jgi:hypothetical protein
MSLKIHLIILTFQIIGKPNNPKVLLYNVTKKKLCQFGMEKYIESINGIETFKNVMNSEKKSQITFVL